MIKVNNATLELHFYLSVTPVNPLIKFLVPNNPSQASKSSLLYILLSRLTWLILRFTLEHCLNKKGRVKYITLLLFFVWVYFESLIFYHLLRINNLFGLLNTFITHSFHDFSDYIFSVNILFLKWHGDRKQHYSR